MSINRPTVANALAGNWLNQARRLLTRRPTGALMPSHQPVAAANGPVATEPALAPCPMPVRIDDETNGQMDHSRVYLRDPRNASRFLYWPDLFRLRRSSVWPFDPIVEFDREKGEISLEFEPFTSIDRLKRARARLINLVPPELSAVGASLEVLPIGAPGIWCTDSTQGHAVPMPALVPDIVTNRPFVVRWQLRTPERLPNNASDARRVDAVAAELLRWLVDMSQARTDAQQRASFVLVNAGPLQADNTNVRIPISMSLQMAASQMFESSVMQTPGSPMVSVSLHNLTAEPLVFRNPCVWLRRTGRRGIEHLTPAPLKTTGGSAGWKMPAILSNAAYGSGLEIPSGQTITLPLLPERAIDGDGPLEALLDESYISCGAQRQPVFQRIEQSLAGSH